MLCCLSSDGNCYGVRKAKTNNSADICMGDASRPWDGDELATATISWDWLAKVRGC